MFLFDYVKLYVVAKKTTRDGFGSVDFNKSAVSIPSFYCLWATQTSNNF